MCVEPRLKFWYLNYNSFEIRKKKNFFTSEFLYLFPKITIPKSAVVRQSVEVCFDFCNYYTFKYFDLGSFQEAPSSPSGDAPVIVID